MLASVQTESRSRVYLNVRPLLLGLLVKVVWCEWKGTRGVSSCGAVGQSFGRRRTREDPALMQQNASRLRATHGMSFKIVKYNPCTETSDDLPGRIEAWFV